MNGILLRLLEYILDSYRYSKGRLIQIYLFIMIEWYENRKFLFFDDIYIKPILSIYSFNEAKVLDWNNNIFKYKFNNWVASRGWKNFSICLLKEIKVIQSRFVANKGRTRLARWYIS